MTNGKNSNQFADGEKREGWNSKNLTEEASQMDGDDIQRRISRGDESKGNADDRDIVGSVDKNETPQGREESKNKLEDRANVNG